MGRLATMGLDTSKSVFPVHGVDAEDGVVIRPKLTRARLLEFVETCPPVWSGSKLAERWARELIGLGHNVRLTPPSYVKP